MAEEKWINNLQKDKWCKGYKQGYNQALEDVKSRFLEINPKKTNDILFTFCSIEEVLDQLKQGAGE